VRTPLPLPHGPGRFTVEPDGTLVFADGSCLAVVRVDAFLNLWSLGQYDQERVCREFAALVHGLAQAQALQVVIESNPTAPEAVIDAVSAMVTTQDATLGEIAGETIGWLGREIARTHVPDLSGYLLVAPAPEVKGGLAGVAEEMRDQLGLRRRSVEETIDRRGLDAAVDDTLAQVKASDLSGHRPRATAAPRSWRCCGARPIPASRNPTTCRPRATPGRWPRR